MTPATSLCFFFASTTLVDRLFERGAIGATQQAMFHDLRRAGNVAAHEAKGDGAEALHQLKMARELGVWSQRTFGNNKNFDPGPFVPPPGPKKADPALDDELARLRADLEKRAKEAADARAAVEGITRTAERERRRRVLP